MIRLTTFIFSLLCLGGHLSFGQTTYYTVLEHLTGGSSYPQGKSWKFVPDPRKTGLGPIQGPIGSWYTFIEGLTGDDYEKGLLDNAYTFRYDSIYIPQNQNVTVQWSHANRFFGKSQAQFDDIHLVDPNHKRAPFHIYERKLISNSTGFRLEITNGSYLGYFENRFAYHIISITADTMVTCQVFGEDAYADPALDSTVRCFTYAHVPTVITELNPETMQGLDMSLYPNPASSSVSFSANVVSYTLYNVAGKAILSGQGTQLDLGALEPGLYPIKLTDSEGKMVYQKLLKE